jgi:hypothetical protein
MAVAMGLRVNVVMATRLISNRLCFIIVIAQVDRLISIRPDLKTDQSWLLAAVRPMDEGWTMTRDRDFIITAGEAIL